METQQPPLVIENRRDHLVRTGKAVPRFLQGVFPFIGRGLFEQEQVDDSLCYTTPAACEAEITYVRAGNFSDEMLYLILAADGAPLRYFPLGAGASCHIELAIVERHRAGSRIQMNFAAPLALRGTIVLDIGLLEICTQ